jgi:RNA polymerase sigma-70 factor, ECF subfamily
MPFNDESNLIDALAQGNDAAFSHLIRQYQSTMLSLARSITGDTFADDVVQEAWVSVYSNIAKFERRSSLKTWLFRIVSNLATTRLRKESRKTSLDQLDGELPGSYLDSAHFREDGHWKAAAVPTWRIESPDELLEEQQLKLCIHKTLNCLPEAQKTVFLLREIEQVAFEEICELLNISGANVRVLLHRARLQLMQMINRYQETGSC